MASSKDTRVLFVQYRPGAASHKSNDDGEISQQKHAAREYHRKAKQRRQTLKQMNGHPNDSTSQTSESPEIVPVRPAKVSTVQKRRTTEYPTRDRSISLPLSPRNLLGAGRIDPMNSLPISDMSPYAQEMLDYCELQPPLQ